jgi:hypothetical protein
VVYFLLSISLALLNEAMVHYNRRHALRSGRLYMYVKHGKIKNIEEFEKAFRWNETVTSSFQTVMTDKFPKNLTSEVIDLMKETIKATSEFARATKEKDSGSSEKSE